MINPQQIKQVLYQLNSEPSDALISHQFTGLLTGISLALKDRKLAEQVESNLKTEWQFGVTGPGGPYAPASMADVLIEELKDAD